MAQVILGNDGIEREFPDGMSDEAIDRIFTREGTQRGGGIPLPGLSPGILPAVGGGAVIGGTALAKRIGSAGRSVVGRAIGKFAARRIPGVGTAMDMADLASDLAGPGQSPAIGGQPTIQPQTMTVEQIPSSYSSASAAPAPAPPARPLAPNEVELSAQDIAEHPEFKRFRPGYRMDRKTYQQTLMGTPGPASRRAKLEQMQPAAADVSAPAEAPGAAKVSSSPELASRQAFARGEDFDPNAESTRAAPRASEAGQRHSVQYTSQSRLDEKGLPMRVDIEDMNTTHLKNAHARLAQELKDAKTPSPVKMAEFKAINAEIKHRATTQPGLTAYKSPVKGDLAKQRAELADILGEEYAKKAGKGVRGTLGGFGPMDVMSLMSEVDPQGLSQFEQQVQHPAQGADDFFNLLQQIAGQYDPNPGPNPQQIERLSRLIGR